MNKTQMNLQDLFLNQMRKDNTPVTIYLISGVQLKGMVRGFDAFTVVLESQGKSTQLVYKHAIASVVPMRPIGMRDLAPEREYAPRTAPAPSSESEEPESTEEE